MTERMTVRWPDPAAFAGRRGRPIRILAVCDEPDPSHRLRGDARAHRAGRPDHRCRRPRSPTTSPSSPTRSTHRSATSAATTTSGPPGRTPASSAAGADARWPGRRGGWAAAHRIQWLADLQRSRHAGLRAGMWTKVTSPGGCARGTRPAPRGEPRAAAEDQRRRRSRAPWVHRLPVAGRPSRAAALAARPHGTRPPRTRRPLRDVQRHALLQLHRCDGRRASSSERAHG